MSGISIERLRELRTDQERLLEQFKSAPGGPDLTDQRKLDTARISGGLDMLNSLIRKARQTAAPNIPSETTRQQP